LKITNVTQNQINFQAGMTIKLVNGIRNANIPEISDKFLKQGIETDFRDNKIIAWCCDKTAEIFTELNKKYGLKLGLPKGIYVEDFKQLKLDDNPNTLAFNLFFPCKVKQGSEKIFRERNLFFNQDSYTWKYLDDFADENFQNGKAASNHFLDIFTHEFSHSAHTDNLLKKNNVNSYAKFIDKALDKETIERINKTYGQELSSICEYAKASPLEAVGCDLSRIIIESLDKKALLPIKNSFQNSPYENLSFLKKLIKNHKDQTPLNNLLENFWNGKRY